MDGKIRPTCIAVKIKPVFTAGLFCGVDSGIQAAALLSNGECARDGSVTKGFVDSPERKLYNLYNHLYVILLDGCLTCTKGWRRPSRRGIRYCCRTHAEYISA